MTDIEGVLNGPVGRICPLVQLVYDVSGGDRNVTLGITFFFLFLGFFVGGPGCMAASSRVIWSFSREGGLPHYFARIHKRQEVPVNALVLAWFCISALSLIYIGNETAYYGISSGVTVVMIFSYALPIFLRLIYGYSQTNLPPGPFTLGSWGIPINILAACWCTYLIIFLCFPTIMPVTKENMNYSVVIFGACLSIPGLAWLAYGKNVYRGVLAEDDSPIRGLGLDTSTSNEQQKIVVDHSSGHEKQT